MTNLRKMRIEKKYTIKELSLKSNVSEKTIRKIEKNPNIIKKCGTMTMIKLADELGCNLSEIL